MACTRQMLAEGGAGVARTQRAVRRTKWTKEGRAELVPSECPFLALPQAGLGKVWCGLSQPSRKVRCEVDERSAATGLDSNCECNCDLDCHRYRYRYRSALAERAFPASRIVLRQVESLCPAKLPSC